MIHGDDGSRRRRKCADKLVMTDKDGNDDDGDGAGLVNHDDAGLVNLLSNLTAWLYDV